MDLRDLQSQIEMLELKVNALSDQVFNNLSELEMMIDQDWIKENPITRRYLIEQQRDVYVTSTVVSDIEKDIERLNEEFCKEKASTSHNFGELDVPATDD